MDIESFREYCLSLPGTTEGMKWGYLCFMIEEKIYIILDIDKGSSFTLKCNPEDFDALISRDGITQASHMAKRQWLQIRSLEIFNDAELTARVAQSRAMVLAKLPKKVQALYL